MTLMEVINCGVEAHNLECLCDVIVERVAPLAVFGWGDLWGGEELAEIRPDLAEDPITFMAALAQAHDVWVEQQNPHRPKYANNGTTLALRRKAFSASYTPEAPLSRVIESCGMTPADFARLFAGSNPPQRLQDWTPKDVDEVQAFMRCEKPSRRRLASALGITADQARSLQRLMGAAQPRAKKLNGDARKVVDELIRKPELSHADVAAALWRRCGVSIDRTYVSKLRKKLYEEAK